MFRSFSTSDTHRTRTKRGKTRHYPKSWLRKRIKRNVKASGLGRKHQRRAASSGWF